MKSGNKEKRAGRPWSRSELRARGHARAAPTVIGDASIPGEDLAPSAGGTCECRSQREGLFVAPLLKASWLRSGSVTDEIQANLPHAEETRLRDFAGSLATRLLLFRSRASCRPAAAPETLSPVAAQ